MYNERREKIKELLAVKPFVSLKELENIFPDISGMTLRRDIEYFEREGHAIKVRGGAKSTKFICPYGGVPLTSKPNFDLESKKTIAKKASEYLETGRSIFIDAGSTMLQLASCIPNERFTFTTPDPNVAIELCKSDMPLVNLIGGTLNRENMSVSGSQAVNFLDNINIDIAFLCPSGISARNGFTVGNYSDCELKRLVTEKARCIVILVNCSKINKNLPYTFCPLDKADIIITDGTLSPDINEIAKANNVNIIDVYGSSFLL